MITTFKEWVALREIRDPRLPDSADYELASHPTSVVDMSTGKVIDCNYLVIVNGKKVPAYRNENGEVVPAPKKMANPEVFNQTPIMRNVQKQQVPQQKAGMFQKAKNWFRPTEQSLPEASVPDWLADC